MLAPAGLVALAGNKGELGMVISSCCVFLIAVFACFPDSAKGSKTQARAAFTLRLCLRFLRAEDKKAASTGMKETREGTGNEPASRLAPLGRWGENLFRPDRDPKGRDVAKRC
ncbi:hypothetical protein BZG19_15315 [Salinivibrio kushneri]|nr:hypothetical protein BZG19_15315 [Salinivibrio kushneri]